MLVLDDKNMTDLKEIPGIGKVACELLETVGFTSAEALAKANADSLVRELERANKVLKISKLPLPRNNVQKWITSARELTGFIEEEVIVQEEVRVNHEIAPKVIAMLNAAPFAIPLPAQFLIKENLAVSDIPAAFLLNRYVGDLDIKVAELIPAMKQGWAVTSSGNVKLAEISGTRREMDTSKIKPIDVFAVGEIRQKSTNPDEENSRIALIRGPRLETNLGRDPQSRWYIRGVLHSHPKSMMLAAFVTLILAVMLPLALISAALLFVSRELPAYFSWVPSWLLVFPVALPVSGIIYLIWGMHGSCRICGQKLFVPKMCMKSPKAHYRPWLGYIVSVSLHLLLFKWFRCTYCGTPVRLKR